MHIVVFTKRVPVTQEEELRILGDGQSVDLAKLPHRMNDWDNYAVEEAVTIAEKNGGAVTGIAIGDTESDEVLRRAIAMGARDGFLVQADKLPQDPYARAHLAYTFLQQEHIAFDAIFTGVQAEDDQFAAFGGILAALLKIPYGAQIIGTDQVQKEQLIVRRELEGGLQERISLSLPCVLSIQSGINEPRYVSIMGVRKASKVERKVFKADVYATTTSLIEITRWVYPPKKEGARMITGEDAAAALLAILKEKGVYQ
jgi:electron transfer flavoprotein beta subunit